MKRTILWIAVAVLIVTNLATIYYLKTRPSLPAKQPDTEQNIKTEPATTTPEQPIASTTPVDANSLTVVWNAPASTSASTVVNYEKFNNLIFASDWKVYKVGTIKGGVYDGKDLYDFETPSDGMGANEFRVIKNNQELIALQEGSSAKPTCFEKAGSVNICQSLFTFNNDLKINNLETPEFINIPDSSLKLDKAIADYYGFRYFTFFPLAEKLFSYDGNNYLYHDKKSGCFFALAGDGTVRVYNLEIPFIKDGKPAISWSDGSTNQAEYSSVTLGCGAYSCLKYSYSSDKNQLQKIGTASDGSDIFALKDLKLKEGGILANIYNGYYPGWDNLSRHEKAKVGWPEFIADRPVIFWQDPFGGFVQFTKVDYQPAVECGKPVIYLYPEKQIDVKVSVAPTGGFSLTEPAYDNGWQVSAKPNGDLYNYGDHKNYPYLFWEGRGLDYQRPTEGFVVAKDGVKKFLEDKLAQLGLIKKESDEFIAFWLPKMQDRNYYFITFVPKSEFDLLAPLQVSPRPDTVIRVFMDYQELDQPVSVQPQKIATPARIGFTVVEWGGALHK